MQPFTRGTAAGGRLPLVLSARHRFPPPVPCVRNLPLFEPRVGAYACGLEQQVGVRQCPATTLWELRELHVYSFLADMHCQLSARLWHVVHVPSLFCTGLAGTLVDAGHAPLSCRPNLR